MGYGTSLFDASYEETYCGYSATPTPVFETFWSESSGMRLVSHITASQNVPDTVAGCHFEQGTSVFACGRAALELVRIDLAQAGLTKQELDNLTTAHVTLQKVSLPFFIRFDDKAQATPKKATRGKIVAPQSLGFQALDPGSGDLDLKKFKVAMRHYALLLGLKLSHRPGYFPVEFRGCEDDTQENSNALKGSTTRKFDGIVLSAECRPSEKLVRIDVNLDEGYLQSHGWDSLDSWRTAYAQNRYECIFNDTVQRMFGLDKKEWDLSKPSEEIYSGSSGRREDTLLREYIAGRNPIASSCFTFEACRSDTKKKAAVKKYRISILDRTGIDIKNPWSKEQHRLRNFLIPQLRYPGDFQPNAERMLALFCKENWQHLLNGLCRAYEDAVSTS